MPELPEAETIARTLNPLVKDKKITGASLLHKPSLDPGSLPLELLTGREILSTGRRGKLVLLKLKPQKGDENEADTLAVHLRMTGRLFVYPAEEAPGKHTRCIINLGAENLFFDDSRTFGRLYITSPTTLPLWPYWNRLGPEPLEMSAEQLQKVLAGKQGRIKALLLDQSILAGMGNIYVDEALFRAGISPLARGKELDAATVSNLTGHIKDVLRESIEACGSSIRDYRTAKGDAGAFQNKFKVYGRAGEPCLKCGHPLSGARVAGRATVFCEYCQK